MNNRQEHIYILMYDITNERILQKIARQLEQHGYERINYSVWAGKFDPMQRTTLTSKIDKLLALPEASGSRFYILPLTISDFIKLKSFDGKLIDQMEYWTGTKQTEFF